MPNEICRVMVEERSRDGLYKWFHIDKQIVIDIEEVKLTTRMATKDDGIPKRGHGKLAKELFEIDGISKASVSKYLLTVNLASEMFDWEDDDIELKVLKVIQDNIGMPVRVIKRKDSDGKEVVPPVDPLGLWPGTFSQEPDLGPIGGTDQHGGDVLEEIPVSYQGRLKKDDKFSPGEDVPVDPRGYGYSI